MVAKQKRSSMGPLIAAGAVGIGLLWWQQQKAQAASAVDPRWLAQQELARRQALGSSTAGTDTLGMILKIGGSAATLGTTVYSMLKKVFDTGTNADAVTALTRYINGGPTDLTTGVDPSMSLSDMVRTWQQTPTATPGAPVSAGTVQEVIGLAPEPVYGIPAGETIMPYEPSILVSEPTVVQTVPSDVPTVEPPMPMSEPTPLPPTDLGMVPAIETGMTVPSYTLTMPGSVFDPSSLEGASGAVLLQSDGLVKLSLTTEQVEQASNIVHLWETGQLDLSLLPADKAAFLSDNLPVLKQFTESGDFGLGQFNSPVSGDTIMRVMPSEVPTGLITEPGAVPPGMLQELLATPLWETTVEVGAAGTAVEAGAGAGITTLGDVLSVVGPVVTIVVACVSMYFTITGNLPDYQKAIYCALDVASIAALFIPVVGWIVAAVIQIVKFVLQKVLGQSKSHEQREAEETAYLLTYGAQELSKELAQAMTVKRVHETLTSWGSGYTGGTRAIAIVSDVVVNGARKIIGLSSDVYAVASVDEFANNIETFSARIQGGVAPEFLAGANASLTGLVQAIVPIMVNARHGDFEATNWLAMRALALWVPSTDPRLRYASSVLVLANTFPEYPWWNEVLVQIAYTLQANVWKYPTWLAMVNDAMSDVLGPTSIERWGPGELSSFSKVYGFSDFRKWRAAFFKFEEPISRALLAGSRGQAKLDEIQTQLDLLKQAKASADAEKAAADAAAAEAAYWQQQQQYISM